MAKKFQFIVKNLEYIRSDIIKKIYVASSWRNPYQPEVVKKLRESGFNVYDFRKPDENDRGFHWSDIDENWKDWTVEEYCKSLNHQVAQSGFKKDYFAMTTCGIGVLVCPCGRSAHLEAGYFVGKGRKLYIYMPKKQEPELMYKMASSVCITVDELIKKIKEDMIL